MTWVLVVITVFSTSAGVATDTAFHPFATRAACVAARDGIRTGVDGVKGTIGRALFAECYPQGERS